MEDFAVWMVGIFAVICVMSGMDVKTPRNRRPGGGGNDSGF